MVYAACDEALRRKPELGPLESSCMPWVNKKAQAMKALRITGRVTVTDVIDDESWLDSCGIFTSAVCCKLSLSSPSHDQSTSLIREASPCDRQAGNRVSVEILKPHATWSRSSYICGNGLCLVPVPMLVLQLLTHYSSCSCRVRVVVDVHGEHLDLSRVAMVVTA